MHCVNYLILAILLALNTKLYPIIHTKKKDYVKKLSADDKRFASFCFRLYPLKNSVCSLV
jgi:hypothetical protein